MSKFFSQVIRISLIIDDLVILLFPKLTRLKIILANSTNPTQKIVTYRHGKRHPNRMPSI